MPGAVTITLDKQSGAFILKRTSRQPISCRAQRGLLPQSYNMRSGNTPTVYNRAE